MICPNKDLPAKDPQYLQQSLRTKEEHQSTDFDGKPEVPPYGLEEGWLGNQGRSAW